MIIIYIMIILRNIGTILIPIIMLQPIELLGLTNYNRCSKGLSFKQAFGVTVPYVLICAPEFYNFVYTSC